MSPIRIAIFGATGQVGGRTMTEALARGHDVTAVVRDPAPGLAVCRSQVDVDWTYLSPPARLEPGTRTGSYRSGSDELVVDDDGSSRISLEDLAVALLDEAERPKHQRARFSSGLLTNFEVG